MIFAMPQSPLESYKPDSGFETEYEALKLLGQKVILFDFEDMIAGGESWIDDFPKGHEKVMYRGWMMNWEQYLQFERSLNSIGLILFQGEHDYNRVHYFPNAYVASETLRKYSPSIYYTPNKSIDLKAPEAKFNGKPYIVKDWVKSAKNVDNAMFVMNPSDYDSAGQTIKNMIEMRELYGFNVGIVCKEFIDLRRDENGDPLEYRAFLFDGELVSFNANGCMNPKYLSSNSEVYYTLLQISKELDTPFMTIDVGYGVDGKYYIMEVGDGGVSGLATSTVPLVFYKRLLELLEKSN